LAQPPLRSVSRPSKTVVRVEVDASAKGFEWWVLLSSDRHHDNAYCNQKAEKAHLDLAKERGAGIIDIGDLFDAMNSRPDPRGDRSQVRPENFANNYFDTLVDCAADFYAPYCENWLLLSPGNHETAALQHHGTNLSDRLADGMRLRSGAERGPMVGTYQGWVALQFKWGVRNSQTYKIRYTHGYGGGGPATKDTIQAQRQLAYLENCDFLLSGHCFSEDTEILTPTGWKTHDQLQVGDRVATMNKTTRAMEFNPVNSVHRYTDYSELLHFKGQGWDLQVTPQHGMIVENYVTGALHECTAEALDGRTGMVFLNAARAVGEDLYGDNELRLMAWVMADGHISGRSVRFHLKKNRKIDRLLELLSAMGYHCTVGPGHNGAVKINLCLDNAWWISEELGQQKDRIPERLYRLNWRQAELFVQEYAHTDGTFYTDAEESGFQLYSVRQDILDLLQALCARAGYRSSMKHRDDCSRLNVCRRGTTHCAKVKAERVPYAGTVWCVNVDNGTLLVRRNGIPVITQNTHDAWYIPQQREYLDDYGNTKFRDVAMIKVGGYKCEFSPGGGWAVGKGHAPKPIGGWWLRFYMEGDRVLYEVTRTAPV
jgi:hypothetical protein